MKIMSFNTQHCQNFITKKIDFEIMAKTIENSGADVIGLNEMRNEGVHPEYTDQVKTLAKKTGYPYYYFAKAIDVPDGGPYGNGILSKIPLESAKTISIPDPEVKNGSRHYETRCILKAELEGGYTVLITHFGLNPDEQKNAVDTVIKNISSEKCILMGDFNLRPENEIINPIREVMTDTADFFSEPKLSFPSDNPYCKIDYIFISRDSNVINTDIPAIIASDHRPHTAEIE